MNIYQIDADIRALIDEDTGEISDYEQFDRLMALREDKIESAAIVYKQMTADASAIKAEIDTLRARQKAAENNAARLKEYINIALGGQSYVTPRVKISYRKSEAVEFLDEADFIGWAKANADDLLTYAEPTVSKTAVKDAIKSGREISGATIVNRSNIQIK